MMPFADFLGLSDDLIQKIALSVGLPIVCGGVAVASGDVVVGDRDGVVVVPRARIDETLKNLERVKAMEAATLERVRGGLKELPVEVPALRRIGRG